MVEHAVHNRQEHGGRDRRDGNPRAQDGPRHNDGRSLGRLGAHCHPALAPHAPRLSVHQSTFRVQDRVAGTLVKTQFIESLSGVLSGSVKFFLSGSNVV